MAKKRKAHFPKRKKAKGSSHSSGWVRMRLAAELLSDAHFGSGSGGSGIDALVARDRHERPVIWASHVEGVLRDAERRLRGVDFVGDFFGRAGGARQRAVFTSLYTNESPESHIWRATAREAFDNRAPKDDTLRVIEYVPRGTKFEGEVELPANDLPVLRRLVQEVDAVGGGRSTGAGRVKLVLTKLDTTQRKMDSPTGRLLLLLKNRDPLCITATATPDNLIPSLAFVPGRTLLGAIAAWLIAEGDRQIASLLTSGRVSVSDALPIPQAPNEMRSVEVLPAPLALQSEKPKGSADDLPWWAYPPRSVCRLDAFNTAEKLKRPEDDLFVYRVAPQDVWTTYRPLRRMRLRNGRPNPKQADASLFAVEQIVEETYFLAELRGAPKDMKEIAAKLAPVLEGHRWLRVGRGGAPVEVERLVWSSNKSSATTSDTGFLTLTSDLLARDEYLRWRTQLDEESLCALLEVDDLRLARTESGVEKAMQESVMVRGFNGTSRLWRMPAAAIRRGSVFEVTGDLSCLKQRIACGAWLGERTHEGFGHFRIDSTLPGVGGGALTTASAAPTSDIEEETIAKTTQCWFNAHKRLAKSGGGSDRKPSLSQWFDLVADLERGDLNAITGRLRSATVGARNWKHVDAADVLGKLQKLQSGQRASHARLFVRWLRAETRKEAR